MQLKHPLFPANIDSIRTAAQMARRIYRTQMPPIVQMTGKIGLDEGRSITIVQD